MMTSVASSLKCRKIAPQFFVPTRHVYICIAGLCDCKRNAVGAKKSKQACGISGLTRHYGEPTLQIP